jgi:DNA-binding NtrC family response regulator
LAIGSGTDYEFNIRQQWSRRAIKQHRESIGLVSQTVLVVDDEADLADTCARLIRGAGFACLVAYNITDALSLFDSAHPALVVSDITLPTGDGFEIARYVRQKSPGTPVILMTAYHTPNAAQEAVRAGAARYLRKPFPNSELISAVKSLIEPSHN